MADKEIIIDVVNVVGCMNYSFKEFINYIECPDYCGEYLDNRCDNHPRCYYKQLKRLEQENTELKAENERLKKENEILLGQLVINDSEDVTVQISESQFDKYNKYRQTLQEIKAIANTRFVNGLNEEADIYNAQMGRILDLITKAEEE